MGRHLKGSSAPMLCIHYSNASTIDNVCIHRDFPSPKSYLVLIQSPLLGIVFIVI